MATSYFTSENELFLHLYDKIMSREIITFGELVEYIGKLSINFKIDNVIKKAFYLLKELHWGFFKEMDKYCFLKLWKELVVKNNKYPDFGDIKRNIAVSDIYIAILDIHGYTKFCEESKHNLSRLHNLDKFLQNGIKKIAQRNESLARRERGDEILIVSPSATDIIATILGIINSFSKRPIFQDETIIRERSDYSINLPEFKISAGVGGGHYSNSLIITEDGFLSGSLLNIAARLQARANELSPTQSKVLITKSVYTSYIKENRITKSVLYKSNILCFFDHGPIDFKDLTLPCYEILFREEEKYRKKYEPYLTTLFRSIKAGLWKQKVFIDTAELIKQVCSVMPFFLIKVKIEETEQEVTPTFISELCDKAKKLYETEDYIASINTLGRIVYLVQHIPNFDKLVLDYANEIYSKYNSIIPLFESALENEINKRIDLIFDEKHKMAYTHIKRNIEIYEKLKKYARNSKALQNRKTIWNTLVENKLPYMKPRIHSGKQKSKLMSQL